MTGDVCNAYTDGFIFGMPWYCTMTEGHRGHHAAVDVDGRVLLTWEES